MSNSSLVSYKKISPNRTSGRNRKIDRISPHCVVGQLSVKSLGSIFASVKKAASSNYGIGYDGKVGMYVEEKDRSWCTSSSHNDNRAVTIECASDAKHPYAFNSVVYNKLIDLCVDICKRNGKTKLLWFKSKSKALNYEPKSNEMVLTVHRWYANKACPGDWLYSRMGDLAKEVTARLSKKTSTTKKTTTKKTTTKTTTKSFKVQVKIDDLNIRTGPGTKYKSKGFIKPGVYTIVETDGKWGKLKSGAGWIHLNYTKKV